MSSIAGEFGAAYDEIDKGLRLRLSKVGCFLALLLVPAFWGLDLLVYPDHARELLTARLVCDIGVLVILALLHTRHGARHIRYYGIAWAMVPCVTIGWMVARMDGVASPYYAGLNLVMIIVSLLMPWTAAEVIILCGFTLTVYLLACAINEPSSLASVQLATNMYFMISTAVICAVSTTYTGRRRLQEFRLRHELDQRNRQLSELDRLKSDFFANISHELRTPLTLILGPLDEVLGRPDAVDPHARDVLRMMRTNALRLLRLINDLLEVVRLEGGRLQLDRRRLDLGTFAAGLTGAVRHLADTKQLTLISEEPQEAVPVLADSSRLEKVLLNLLTNAIKFTPSGGTIRVGVGAVGDRAQLWVQDDGIGIPASELPFVFDRFRQVESSSTRRYQGVGIGLALAKDLVEAHDGQLTVSSAHGQGCTFTVSLPLASSATAAEASPLGTPVLDEDPIIRNLSAADRSGLILDRSEVPPAALLRPPGVVGPAGRILVVDDEPDMRRFTVSLLSDHHDISEAVDGPGGLARAEAELPEIILLDMMLPGMNGLEVCRRLRENPALERCRIIMLTARADDETRHEALRLGADDFLTKPFSGLELRLRVLNHLRSARLADEIAERNQELQTAMAELRAAQAQLIQSEKMNSLGSMAAGLMHEINNPLNYTKTALHFAKGNLPADAGMLAEVLADIEEGMDRIQGIIDALRSFAYPEADGMTGIWHLDEVVATALRFSAEACRGIAVTTEIPPDLTLPGSGNQISQVLVNLILNACHAIRAVRAEGEGRLTIVAAIRDAETLALRVTDNGSGIPSEKLKRIFDPFFTTKEIGEGTGLGLSVSHTIIERHDGRIEVDSTPGEGTTFTLLLPVAIPSETL